MIIAHGIHGRFWVWLWIKRARDMASINEFTTAEAHDFTEAVKRLMVDMFGFLAIHGIENRKKHVEKRVHVSQGLWTFVVQARFKLDW
jgi:hypothetical protein